MTPASLLPRFLASTLLVAVAGRAFADPSAPDPGFGDGGVVIENLGSIETVGRVMQLSTGKLLLLGGGSGVAAVHSLTRYHENGEVDETYGSGGTASGHTGTLWNATLLPGDAVLVAGDVDTQSLTHLNDAAVMRYTSTGAKDGTFGTEGRITFRLDPDVARDEHATDVIPLSGGRLLVGGWFAKGVTDTDIAVVRLLANGSIDTGFGEDGYFHFDFMGGLDKVHELHELSDGGILVYGEVTDTVAAGQPSKLLFLKLNSEGAIDTTYGGSGTGLRTVLTDVNSDLPGGLVPLADDAFLFGVNGTALWTVGRIDGDGILDAGFGTGGIAKLTPVFPDGIFPAAQTVGVARQSDGRVVVGGWVAALNAQFQLRYDVGLARFEEDGTPDTTWNSGSAQRLYTITTAAPETAANVIVQKDGKIVLGGSYPNGADDRFMLRVMGDEPVVTTTTTTTLPETLCGDANGDGKITAADALVTLKAGVGIGTCPVPVCDVTGDGQVRAADALRILKRAVGSSVDLLCAA